MGRCPPQCPRRIYFVWNDAIRAYHEVTQMVVVRAPWHNTRRGKIYMKTEIHNLQEPIPIKGFRGYRYGVDQNGNVLGS